MRGLRDISLGIAAALAIASLDVMPALADEVAASPAQAVNEQKVVTLMRQARSQKVRPSR